MKHLSISRRSFLYLLCFLNLFYFPEVARAQDKSPSYAITHAKIFTVSGTAIDDGTIVIQNGKIANVGAAVEVPAGAHVIDGKGLQVYPGLFDPITQMGLREIGAVNATVDSAETGAFNPDVVASEAVLPSSEHIPVTRAAGITEVLAVPASGGMDSEGPTGVLGGQASASLVAQLEWNDSQRSVDIAIAPNAVIRASGLVDVIGPGVDGNQNVLDLALRS